MRTAINSFNTVTVKDSLTKHGMNNRQNDKGEAIYSKCFDKTEEFCETVTPITNFTKVFTNNDYKNTATHLPAT